MNVPMPPTDNLYKFIALSGTAILILSIYIPMEYLNKLNDKAEALNLKIATLEAETNQLHEKSSKLNQLLKDTIDVRNRRMKIDRNKVTLYYEPSEIKEMKRKIDELSMSLHIKDAEAKQYSEHYSYAIKKYEQGKTLSFVFGMLGFLLASLGYQLWYNRIQKYQDISIKREAFKNK